MRKRRTFSVFLIRLRFLGYQCKSGVVNFARRGLIEITLTDPLNSIIQMDILIQILKKCYKTNQRDLNLN